MEPNEFSEQPLSHLQAAIVLNCSVSSIRRYKRSKTARLDSKKVGPKSVQFSKATILAFLSRPSTPVKKNRPHRRGGKFGPPKTQGKFPAKTKGKFPPKKYGKFSGKSHAKPTGNDSTTGRR